jgi:divalent metal cation (Fe/Co/Zn/Cd) transporter
VALSGWQRLDPIVALIVAGNIIWSGVRIVRKSVMGLMDTALPVESQDTIQKVLESYKQKGIQYHALRTRQSGSRQFVSFHVIVPGSWTVHEGHSLLERIEADLRGKLPKVTLFTHLESKDDPSSWDDIMLDREETSAAN